MLQKALTPAIITLLMLMFAIGSGRSEDDPSFDDDDATKNSEEFFDPSQQAGQFDILNGFLNSPMPDIHPEPVDIITDVVRAKTTESHRDTDAISAETTITGTPDSIASSSLDRSIGLTTTESAVVAPVTGQFSSLSQVSVEHDEITDERTDSTPFTTNGDYDKWSREPKTISHDPLTDNAMPLYAPVAAELTLQKSAVPLNDDAERSTASVAPTPSSPYGASAWASSSADGDAGERTPAIDRTTAASTDLLRTPTTGTPVRSTAAVVPQPPTAAQTPPPVASSLATVAAVEPTTRRTTPKVETSIGVDEILRRNVYESHVRMPMAILVDATPGVLRKTRTLWSASLKPQPNLDVILMTFNMSGIGVTYKFNNTRTLFAGLESLQDSREGPGATFFGLVRVTKLIPYDSAIFVCTDRPPYDPNVGKYAAINLLKKRIRVFLIWLGDPVPAGSIEGGTLGELALQSGGDILRVTDDELRLIQLYERNDVLAHNHHHADGVRSTSGLLKRIRRTGGNVQPQHIVGG